MLKDHLKIALRNILRHKTYAFINVLGLALGICTCIVIFLITHYEFSTDSFHPDKDRIYRVIEVIDELHGTTDKAASAPPAFAKTAREKFSGYESIASYWLYSAKIRVAGSANERTAFDNTIEGTNRPSTILAEQAYFSIFHYEWLSGNAATALEAPNTVVLTKSKAQKYFGSLPLEQIIGRTLIFNDSLPVSVTGIVSDWKSNTDFPFTEFISYPTAQNPVFKKTNPAEDPDPSSSPFNSRALVKLQPGESPARLQAQLDTYSRLRKEPNYIKYTISLQPLGDVHFDENVHDGFHKAHLPSLYVLMGISAFILLLAAINFINLSTALSIRRAKEIGIRKVMGSSRLNIALQFLSETFLLTLAALILAILAVRPMLAAFQNFIPKGITNHLIDPANAFFLFLLVFTTTLLAGFYPARVLSAYIPVLSLKGGGTTKGQSKWYLRRGLIVFQFAISLIFIISTIIISRQVNYMRTKDLGFNTDEVVSFFTDPGDRSPNPALLQQRLTQLAGVQKISRQSFVPLSDIQTGLTLQYKGKPEKQIEAGLQIADSNFISLYKIRLLAGRNLIPAVNRDSIKEFLINESLMHDMGIKTPQDAIGKFVYLEKDAYPIVGVVADFHENSYRLPIRPLAMFDLAVPENSFAVKLNSKGRNLEEVKNTLTQMEHIWKEIYPQQPFSYSFLDESIAALYKTEAKTANLMNVATGITIFISCMGLFGLSLFTSAQRTKEVGIRKVLGASVMNITSLLTLDFLRLISLSLVIASPIAWYITHRWLQDYLYRAPITIWIFVIAGTGALFLGLLAVSFQTARAATANPVDSLRAE